jgi:hypothetical protein
VVLTEEEQAALRSILQYAQREDGRSHLGYFSYGRAGVVLSNLLDRSEITASQEPSEKKNVLVETISIHRMTYVIPIGSNESSDFALDSVTMGEYEEIDQQHLEEVIVSHRDISDSELEEMLPDWVNGHMKPEDLKL